MTFHEGWYYYCESRNQNRSIAIRRSKTLLGIGQDDGLCVWNAPARGRNSHALWAPELHRLGNRWYIYYAADDGRNENHRMWVLESETDDPLSRYHCRGQIATEQWAIDGTVFEHQKQLYFIWSGWPGATEERQNLYIAPMKDPLTLSGERVLLATPDQSWEQQVLPICEGPQVLRGPDALFVVYSASASWTEHYCLGLLVNRTHDFLNPKAWEKRGPVLPNTEQVWGIGHCSFVTSPCQRENWIVYHSKSKKDFGWEDRDVHAKPFTWSADGLPNFGTPPPRGTLLHIPPTSPDNKPPLLVKAA